MKKKHILSKTFNIISNSMSEICNLMLESIASLFLPVLDLLASVINTMSETLFQEVKIVLNTSMYIRKNAKQYASISVFFYQILLLACEGICFYKIAEGKIEYTSFTSIITYTVIILIYGISFIVLMQKNYRNSNYSYVVYAQLLLLIPLIMVYWITYIEEKTIYLKDLNADQWISIFNTIVIYFSACFIGLVGMYKVEKERKEQINLVK